MYVGNSDAFGRIDNAMDDENTFLGKLDDIRLYSRALPDAEIAGLYQAEAGNLDSDGDGLTDAWERGFARYQLIPGSFTWEQAKADAETRGGHLATITSEEEQAFLESYLNLPASLNGQTWAWLGATDREEEGNWRWVTGESWNYSHWAPHEPNNGWGGIEHYLVMNDYWNDVSDLIPGYRYGYILEFGYPTNPLLADTDGDGFSDGAEIAAGRNPLDGKNGRKKFSM